MLRRDIVAALQGIRHLQVTYRNDSKTVARLQVCIDATERHLSRAPSGGGALASHHPAEHVQRADGAHISADCARFVLGREAGAASAAQRPVMQPVQRPRDGGCGRGPRAPPVR